MAAAIIVWHHWPDARAGRLRMAWIVPAVFLFRAIGDFRYVGVFKRVHGTRFARLDTLAYSPLCLLIALLTAASLYTGH